MDSAAGSQTPSMQDILASIKRIIADPAVPGTRPVEEQAMLSPDEDDVLHLGAGIEDAPPAPTISAIPAAIVPPSAVDGPLLSGAAHAASAQAMATLSTLSIDPHAASHTLDGLVRELLRPMLKDWLDANLPDLVERVVAREVARLGGR